MGEREEIAKGLAAAQAKAEQQDEVARLIQDRRANRARAELQSIVRRLEEQNEQLEDRVDFLLGLHDYKPNPPKIRAKAAKSGKNPAVAVALATDWHMEERVDKSVFGGGLSNEYTPEIAEERAVRFFQNFHRLIDVQRSGCQIDTALLWLGGDLLTGYIHEELMETSWLSPSQAALRLFDILKAGIDYLLARADLRTLRIPCSYGNHGRTTQRSRVSSGAANSFEWNLYHHLQKHYMNIPDGGEKRVHFEISDGPNLYCELGDFTIRFSHGDDFRFQGGVGGLLIPMAKWITARDTERVADLTCIGHWHQYLPGTRRVVNGSLIGPNAYSTSRVKSTYEPPQQAFLLVDLVHRQATGHFPIRVT